MMSSASVSMSNRAPNALDTPERRASQPSVPSRTVTAIASTVAAHASAGVYGSPSVAASSATSASLAEVMTLAAPNRRNGWCGCTCPAATAKATRNTAPDLRTKSRREAEPRRGHGAAQSGNRQSGRGRGEHAGAQGRCRQPPA